MIEEKAAPELKTDVSAGMTPPELEAKVTDYTDSELFLFWRLYKDSRQDSKRVIVTREMGRRGLID